MTSKKRDPIYQQTKDLDLRIQALRSRIKPSDPKSPDVNGFGLTLTIISDLVGGLLFGAAIGFMVQGFLDARPYVWAVFIFLGGLAGMLNAFKYVRRLEKRSK